MFLLDFIQRSLRSHPGRTIALTTLVVLSIKTFFGILYEYQWYFPPDYDHSAFLSGRRRTFVGIYRPAFYTHIVVGPITMLLGTFSIVSGVTGRFGRAHRWTGRANVALVLTVVVPSGLLMTLQAYGGVISMVGFSVQTLATGVCAAMTIRHARAFQFAKHRQWAMRLYLLLISPLFLRLIAGVMTVTHLESEWTYRINAWISWMVPLLWYEFYSQNKRSKNKRSKDVESPKHVKSP
jgi:uncharacterized membrane protein